MKLCKCGAPAHPCYGDRCEDCYALAADAAMGHTRTIKKDRDVVYGIDKRYAEFKEKKPK